MESNYTDTSDGRTERDTKEDAGATVAFVCVQNAGRSQMATAFAQREREGRNLDIEILSGGTHPADHVHAIVVEVMAERGIDLSNRTPRQISPDELRTRDQVVTMGCSTLTLDTARVRVHNWDLDDPHGKDIAVVRNIRDDIERRVIALLEQITRY